MYNPLGDFKNTVYSVILFLVFPICFLQAQTVFEKLPNIETLSPRALKQIEKQKKNGLVITDTPAAIFINNYRGKNNKLFHKFKKLEQEIYKFSGFDGAVAASFPMMTLSSSGVSFKSGDAEFVLDSVYMPECGVILNNGKEAPVIIRGLKDSYVPEFKAYFGVANTEAFQKLVNKFEKKADRKSNRQFRKDFKNKINDINEDEGEHIAFPAAADEANTAIFKALFVEENIIPDYTTLKNTKKVYIEYTAGSWKGRNYTFEYDEQQRIVAYKRKLYDNTDIDTYKVKYFSDGLIKKMDHISERTDIDSKSYETILLKTPDPLTLRVLVVPSKGEGAAVSIELDDLYSYDFYYDTLYQLKEMKWLRGQTALNDTKYYYENKNLVKKVWTVLDGNKPPLLVKTENFSYNKKNEMIGRNYNHKQKDGEPMIGSYILSPKGEKEVGKDSMTLTYYYDKQGRKVLIKETNENFPYEIRFTYEDFDYDSN
jgi:hypothetical protein